jgi:uncharacterized membrane protein
MSARMAAALLSLVGLLVALYLTLFKLGVIGELACGTAGSCETVQLSRWAVFLGVPVAAWGAAFYALTLGIALAALQPRWADARAIPLALTALAGWGVLFSVWLTALELFVIHAICLWCVTSAVLVTMLFVASLVDLRQSRRSTTPAGRIGSTSSPTPIERSA